ncbi:hypothetical protein QAD02_000669 [Eretmocerus hayati]|uniref:Uncharacterized protein n=1 Tax=Eretmocerus hayati TaxID=131215 RepID=A0ACC2NE22_9HYME|nr:hypothetical protein QAD02_000669 [Eretmocerus hayati]
MVIGSTASAIDTGLVAGQRLRPIDECSLNASVNSTTGVLARMPRFEEYLVNSCVISREDSPAQGYFMHHHPNNASLGKGLDGLIKIGSSAQLFHTHCLKLVQKI